MKDFDDLYYKKAAWLCEGAESDEDETDDTEISTDDVEAIEEIECPDCDGTGEDEDGNECETCGGTGVIAPEESEEDIVDDAEAAIDDAEDETDDTEAEDDETAEDEEGDEGEETDVEPEEGEEYELDLADPVCPCCGAHLNVIAGDEDADAAEAETEEEPEATTTVDGFEVADPSIMGPETNIYYSDDDAEPVEYDPEGDEDEEGVDEACCGGKCGGGKKGGKGGKKKLTEAASKKTQLRFMNKYDDEPARNVKYICEWLIEAGANVNVDKTSYDHSWDELTSIEMTVNDSNVYLEAHDFNSFFVKINGKATEFEEDSEPKDVEEFILDNV